jgi:WD40 repeat protein
MGHTAEVNSALFSPDGGKILSASQNDLMARLWDRDGNLLANLMGLSGKVTSAPFAPDDGRIMVTFASSVALDNSARLWDGDGRPLFTLRHSKEVTYGVFSPDGNRILTTTYDGTVWLWDRLGKPSRYSMATPAWSGTQRSRPMAAAS